MTEIGVFRCGRVVATLVALMAIAGGAEKHKSTDAEYEALVKRVTAGDFSIDFRALRVACANASRCDPRGDREDMTAMRRAAQGQHYDEVVKAAQKLIGNGFANIEAHAASADAYAALEKPEQGDFHRRVTSALLWSIFGTGDGKTKETAFEVIGTYEERIVLTVMGLPPFGNQSLISGKPHSYDVIEVDDPKTGQKVSVYFNIDAFYPMKGLRQ